MPASTVCHLPFKVHRCPPSSRCWPLTSCVLLAPPDYHTLTSAPHKNSWHKSCLFGPFHVSRGLLLTWDPACPCTECSTLKHSFHSIFPFGMSLTLHKDTVFPAILSSLLCLFLILCSGSSFSGPEESSPGVLPCLLHSLLERLHLFPPPFGG